LYHVVERRGHDPKTRTRSFYLGASCALRAKLMHSLAQLALEARRVRLHDAVDVVAARRAALVLHVFDELLERRVGLDGAHGVELPVRKTVHQLCAERTGGAEIEAARASLGIVPAALDDVVPFSARRALRRRVAVLLGREPRQRVAVVEAAGEGEVAVARMRGSAARGAAGSLFL
jgi:hypothetical protein